MFLLKKYVTELIMIHGIQAIILAAGMSSRFGVEANKLVTPLCGKPLIMHVITPLQKADLSVTVVVGHQKELVSETIVACSSTDVIFVEQEEQKGTGHAVMCSRDVWQANHILVLNGDMPLISHAIIDALYTQHQETDAAVSFVTALPDTTDHAYGRVIQDKDGIRIVEARDFAGDVNQPHPINAGIYLFKRAFLENYINRLTDENASHELYLTDLIAVASRQGKTVTTLTAPFNYVRGVNTLEELCTAEALKRKQIISHWMHNGVRFIMPETTHIDAEVTVGRGTIISAGVHLLGSTTIGTNCTIEPFSIIHNSTLADHVTIHNHSLVRDAQLAEYTTVGPFAHLRDNVQTEEHVAIGNFVEVKNSQLGAYTKAKHLTYLGDTTTGHETNIGAGTITCNYDGVKKHPTIIGNKVFIGSNNTLIAPVTIEDDVYTAAGSTITQDVPKGALAIGRARQMNKLGYAQKLRKKTKTSKPHNAPEQQAK